MSMMMMGMGGGGGGGASAAPSKDFLEQKSQLQQFMDMQLVSAQDFLGIDSHEGARKAQLETALREEVEGQLKLFQSEHGEVYELGIRPNFDAKKVRIYDSFWNWVIVDAMDLHYTTVFQVTLTLTLTINPPNLYPFTLYPFTLYPLPLYPLPFTLYP